MFCVTQHITHKTPRNRGFLFITHQWYIANFQKSANKNHFLYNGLFRPGSGWGIIFDAVARWQRFLPCCIPLCQIKYCSFFQGAYMPDSNSDTDCATMSARTLQHVPNRRVFHMRCDTATQSRTPGQSYCDYRCVSSAHRARRCTYCSPSICSAPPAAPELNHRHCA